MWQPGIGVPLIFCPFPVFRLVRLYKANLEPLGNLIS